MSGYFCGIKFSVFTFLKFSSKSRKLLSRKKRQDLERDNEECSGMQLRLSEQSFRKPMEILTILFLYFWKRTRIYGFLVFHSLRSWPCCSREGKVFAAEPSRREAKQRKEYTTRLPPFSPLLRRSSGAVLRPSLEFTRHWATQARYFNLKPWEMSLTLEFVISL